ncbi:HD domain-containing phosphohydrolase [Acidobacteriota bacterium]
MKKKELEPLKALIEMSALINSTLDIGEITERTIEASIKLVDAEAGSLLLLDAETGELYFEVALGEKGNRLKAIKLKMGEGIAGWVAKKGKPQIVHDVNADKRFFRKADNKSTFATKSMLSVPLKTKDRTVGVLEVLNKKSGKFNNGDVAVLSALANQVAVAIENANLYQELKTAFHGTTQTLVETLEKRDLYTGGHTKRVMEYSLAIGTQMGFGGAELESLKLAAILHDIGKIGIRDRILLKEGKLTSEELEKMTKHAGYGAEILKPIKHLEKVIPGVKSHHERYDGTGYPEGLKGKKIPLVARIIAVADTFDAMTTDRPYRKSFSAKEAFNELKRHGGTQFDPKVVAAFFEVWKREISDDTSPSIKRE